MSEGLNSSTLGDDFQIISTSFVSSLNTDFMSDSFKVFFHNVKDTYEKNEPIKCVFSFENDDDIKADDVIGIVESNSVSINLPIEYSKKIVEGASLCINNNKLCYFVEFEGNMLPKDAAEYAFIYLRSGMSISRSESFSFGSTESEYTEIEDPNDPGLVVFKSRITKLNERVEQLNTEKAFLINELRTVKNTTKVMEEECSQKNLLLANLQTSHESLKKSYQELMNNRLQLVNVVSDPQGSQLLPAKEIAQKLDQVSSLIDHLKYIAKKIDPSSVFSAVVEDLTGFLGNSELKRVHDGMMPEETPIVSNETHIGINNEELDSDRPSIQADDNLGNKIIAVKTPVVSCETQVNINNEESLNDEINFPDLPLNQSVESICEMVYVGDADINEVQTKVPTESDIYEVQTQVPTESDIYEVQTQSHTESDIYEVQTQSPTQSDIYEVQTQSPTESDIYEVQTQSPTESDIYEVQTQSPTESDICEVQTQVPDEHLLELVAELNEKNATLKSRVQVLELELQNVNNNDRGASLMYQCIDNLEAKLKCASEESIKALCSLESLRIKCRNLQDENKLIKHLNRAQGRAMQHSNSLLSKRNTLLEKEIFEISSERDACAISLNQLRNSISGVSNEQRSSSDDSDL